LFKPSQPNGSLLCFTAAHRANFLSALLIASSLHCLGQTTTAPHEHPIDARRRAPPPRRLPLFMPATPFGPIFPRREELLVPPLFPCMVSPLSSLLPLSSTFGFSSRCLTSRATFPCNSPPPQAAGAPPPRRYRLRLLSYKMVVPRPPHPHGDHCSTPLPSAAPVVRAAASVC
jgi:hypothetical protein